MSWSYGCVDNTPAGARKWPSVIWEPCSITPAWVGEAHHSLNRCRRRLSQRSAQVPVVVILPARCSNHGPTWLPKASVPSRTTRAMVAIISPYSTTSCPRSWEAVAQRNARTRSVWNPLTLGRYVWRAASTHFGSILLAKRWRRCRPGTCRRLMQNRGNSGAGRFALIPASAIPATTGIETYGILHLALHVTRLSANDVTRPPGAQGTRFRVFRRCRSRAQRGDLLGIASYDRVS
jgi:hypothetical protein